jgi:hypothetical protein
MKPHTNDVPSHCRAVQESCRVEYCMAGLGSWWLRISLLMDHSLTKPSAPPESSKPWVSIWKWYLLRVDSQLPDSVLMC